MTDATLAEILERIPQGVDSAFPAAEYERRVAALQRLLAGRDIDLLLTTGAENVFYLCGQQTPGYYTFQCLAVPAKGPCFLVNRGLESMNARMNSFLSTIEGYADDADPAVAVAEVLKARGWQGKRVAIDRNSWFLTVNLYDRLIAAFGPLLDGSSLVEPLRRVKSPAEIAAIEQAAKANDAGMSAGLALVRAGTERERRCRRHYGSSDLRGIRISRHGTVRHFRTALRRAAYDVAPPRHRGRRSRHSGDRGLLQSLSRCAVPHRCGRQSAAKGAG